MAFKGKPKQVGPTKVPPPARNRTPFVWGSEPRSLRAPTPQRIKPSADPVRDYGKGAAMPANPAGIRYGGPDYPTGG